MANLRCEKPLLMKAKIIFLLDLSVPIISWKPLHLFTKADICLPFPLLLLWILVREKLSQNFPFHVKGMAVRWVTFKWNWNPFHILKGFVYLISTWKNQTRRKNVEDIWTQLRLISSYEPGYLVTVQVTICPQIASKILQHKNLVVVVFYFFQIEWKIFCTYSFTLLFPSLFLFPHPSSLLYVIKGGCFTCLSISAFPVLPGKLNI